MFKSVAKVAVAVTFSAAAFSSFAQSMGCDRISSELRFWSRQYTLQQCVWEPVTHARCESIRQLVLKYSRMYRENNCGAASRSLVDEDGFRID